MAMSLKAARVNANLTQEQAAKTIGVSTNTVSRWELGISAPHYKHLANICKAYGLTSYDEIIFLPRNNA